MYSSEVSDLIATLESRECDDCGKKEVEWASIRKGTLICSECFCFHGYLGPAVSLTRNLRKGAWDEEHIRLVHTLSSGNTNKIWESALYEGTTKWKKPEPHDPPHIKEKFVREKYERLGFQPKLGKGDQSDTQSLNSQLIACVRSDFVLTTLRLIALGADVNYVDPETGDTALHVAAREGNANQVELLFLHGADILIMNREGLLPHIAAKEAGQIAISQRIYEFFWYIFDRFTFHVCSRKPDHKNNQDFLIPEVTDKSIIEKTKVSRNAISALPKSHFFDLCEDAFDEVIRRENEAIWATTTWARSTKGTATLFLPPSTQMSAARNQRRQKLAKFSRIQFTILLIDLIKEQKRKISGEPVPSTPIQKSINRSMEKSMFTSKKADNADYDEVAGIIPSSPISMNKDISLNDLHGTIVWDEVLEMKERMGHAEHLIITLTKQNEELTKMVHGLQAQVININSESISLRDEINRLNRLQLTRRLPSPLSVVETPERMNSVVGTPQSMGRRESEDKLEMSGARWRSNSRDRLNSNSIDHRPEKRIEKRIEIQTESSSSMASRLSRKTSLTKEEFNHVIEQGEAVTRAIRTLLQHGHNGNLDNNASNCAYDISYSIQTLITMFPAYVNKDKIKTLVDSLVMLNAKCNSPQLMPYEIIDAAQSVADKLRLALLDV